MNKAVQIACVAIFFLIALLGAAQALDQQMLLGDEMVPVRKGRAPLYQFIDFVDESFDYQTLSTVSGAASTISSYNLTSGRWLTAEDTSANVWYHRMVLVEPTSNFKANYAMVFVEGCNSNLESCYEKRTAQYVELAEKYNVSVLVLFNIPPQPVTFFGSSPVTEDDLMALSWAKTIAEPTRPDYAINLPIARAVVRAMDVLEISKGFKWFYLAGISKRAHAVWLAGLYESSRATATTPSRVVGAAPMAYDLLNFGETVGSQSRILGGLTLAFYNYKIRGFLAAIDTAPAENVDALLSILDPLSSLYKKDMNSFQWYVVSGSADEFFIPTNDQFYWKDIKNTATRFLIPGGNHGFSSAKTVDTLNVAMEGVFGNLKAASALINTYERQMAIPCGLKGPLFNLCGRRPVIQYPLVRPDTPVYTVDKTVKANKYEMKFTALFEMPTEVILYSALNKKGADWRDTTVVFNKTTVTPVVRLGRYIYTVDVQPLINAAEVPTDGSKTFSFWFVAKYTSRQDVVQYYSSHMVQYPETHLEQYEDCFVNKTCNQQTLIPWA